MTKTGTLLAGACLLVAAFAVPALADETDDTIDRTADIFGEPFSLALVTGLKNACTHANDVMAASSPETRVLLMSDREITKFYEEPCDGVCDFVQTNEIVTRCIMDEGIEGCVIYGAVFGGEFYDVAFDPYGDKVVDCAR